MALMHDVTEGVNIIEEENAHLTEEDISSTILLSTGVVLGHSEKAPSKMVLSNILNRYEFPDPPMADIGKGRNEPNPSDPDYLATVEQIEAKRGFAFYDALVLLGTVLISYPDDIAGPENPVWYEDIELLGFEIDKRPKALYLSWVRNYAANTEEDMKRIITFVLSRLGATEEQVRLELDKFPDN